MVNFEDESSFSIILKSSGKWKSLANSKKYKKSLFQNDY